MNCNLNLRLALTATILGFIAVAPLALRAQEDGRNGPPKILVIDREILKPGRDGGPHEKAESAFIQALSHSKAPMRYFALTSLSGPSRALFFFGYPSLEAWEKTEAAVEKDTVLAKAIDDASVADGDLLTEFAQSVWMRRDDQSLNTHNLVGYRYMEVTQFKVRQGHMHEWNDLVKLVTAGYKKGVPNASWVTFQQVYGTAGQGFLVITPLKSLADGDQEMTWDKSFTEAMGEDGMKKVEELSAACIEDTQQNLFRINPKMSYPPESWIQSEPDFWKPKTTASVTKKPAAKSTQSGQ